MKTKSLIVVLLMAFVWLSPLNGRADQTDPQLDTLFQTLKSSEDAVELMQTENAIWGIWHETDNDTVNALMERASERMQGGDLIEAESLYSRVIEEAPDFSEGWNRRATVRFYRNDLDGSLADIEQTLKLEPRHFGAMWGLGMILGSQGDYARAILAFEKLLEIKPNSPDAQPRIEQLKRELTREAV